MGQYDKKNMVVGRGGGADGKRLPRIPTVELLNPGCDRLKSSKIPTLGKRFECHKSSGITLKKTDAPSLRGLRFYNSKYRTFLCFSYRLPFENKMDDLSSHVTSCPISLKLDANPEESD